MNTELSKVLQQLDYALKTFEERNKLVNELIDIDWYLLLDAENLKVDLNKDDTLYSDTPNAKFLEIVSSYLLNSPDVKQEDKNREGNIKIYHSKELFDRELNEEKLRGSLLPTGEDNLDITIFVKQRNFKKDKDIKVKPSDIKSSKTLTDYMLSIEGMKYRLKVLENKGQLNKEETTKKRLLRKHIGTSRIDMEDTYISEHRPIIFKAPLKDNGCPNWDALDMFQVSHIKNLLGMTRTEDISNDLNHILMDLENIIQEIELKPWVKRILDLILLGYNNKMISNELNITPAAVSKGINIICKEISNAYITKYTDWYYLNIVKGKYRKCEICKNNKLIHEFNKDSLGHIKKICKECENNCKK